MRTTQEKFDRNKRFVERLNYISHRKLNVIAYILVIFLFFFFFTILLDTDYWNYAWEMSRGIATRVIFHASNSFYDFSSLSILSFHALTFCVFRCCCFFFFLSLQNVLQLFYENVKFDYRGNGLNFNGNTSLLRTNFSKMVSIYILLIFPPPSS